SRSEVTYLFRPAVMLLDAEFHITRTLENDFDSASAAGDSLGLQTSMTVDPRAERYLVIYTRAALLGQTTLLKVRKRTRSAFIEEEYPVANAPVGGLEVSAQRN
ncbi:MAG: MalM family protein, partial [Burkholderiales bacterium]